MGITTAVQDMRTIKRLLEGAEKEARGSGETTPGLEHLLLAAMDLPDGSAARAFDRFGVDIARLRSAIEEVHARALAGAGIEASVDPATSPALRGPAAGVFRSSPQAQQAFQEAVALSKGGHGRGLRGAYVVAAVCDLRLGTAVRALAALGVEREHLKEVALAEAQTG